MIGATAITIADGMIPQALFPSRQVLCAYVAYARWDVVPLHDRRG
jgi:hypothetical protein